MTTSTLARATDPLTSHAAAESLTTRTSHKDHLLATYVNVAHGLTADEAAERTALLDTGYWKRISDLTREGLLESRSDQDVRPGRSGRLQRVLHITVTGEQYALRKKR